MKATALGSGENPSIMVILLWGEDEGEAKGVVVV
jgi:hypothetical protein